MNNTLLGSGFKEIRDSLKTMCIREVRICTDLWYKKPIHVVSFSFALSMMNN